MNRSLILLSALTAALPLAVEVGPDTSATASGDTRAAVSGGFGYYAFIARGCEGQQIDHVPVHFREAGGELSHRFGATPARLGVRAGYVEDRVDSTSAPTIAAPVGQTIYTRYVNPHIAWEGKRGSIGVGWVFHEGEFMTTSEGEEELLDDHAINNVSFHVALGDVNRKYFAVRWMESVPLYSGGGYLTIGGGGQTPHGPLELHGGLGAGGPYDGGGLYFNARYRLPEGGVLVRLDARAGYGGLEGQTGAALGLEWRSGGAR